MFEVCQANPFDLINNETNSREGSSISIINIIHFVLFVLVLTLDSEDDFEVV